MTADPIYVVSLPAGTPPDEVKRVSAELTAGLTAGKLVLAIAGGTITTIPRPTPGVWDGTP